VQYDLGKNGANGLYSATMGSSGCPSFSSIASNANGFVFGNQVTGSPYTTGAPMNAANGTPCDYPISGGNGTCVSTTNQLGRIDITVAPSNANYVYAQVCSIVWNNNSGCGNTNGCQIGAWASTDGGGSWSYMEGSQGGSLRNCNNGQGDYPQNWYNQGVAVDPNNPDRVFFDTFDIWFATRTGTVWNDTSCGYSGSSPHPVHVDQHALAFVPGSSSILTVGNDGGVHGTANADVVNQTTDPTWFNMDNNISTIEFYSGDISGNFANSASPQASGGSQDNASSSVTFAGAPTGPVQWQVGIGGDGFYSRIDPVGTGTNLRFFQGNNSGGMSRCVSNCTVGGAAWSSVRGGWGSDTQSFILPYDLFHGGVAGGDDCPPAGVPGGCGHLIAATTRVWETIAGGNASMGTADWYITNTPTTQNMTKQTLGNRSYINQVKYSPKYSSVAMLGTNDANVWIGFNLGTGTASQANWVNVTGNNTVVPLRPVQGIALDPTVSAANLPVGYAAVGGFNPNTPGSPGHVFQLTCAADCGSFTWLDKTGNLPDIPVDSIIVNPNNAHQVYAGTDWGVYYTDDITVASPTWLRFENGIPHAMVWDMQIDRGSTTLSVWTRSRGAYAFPLPTGGSSPTPTPTASTSGSPSPTPTATATATHTPTATPTATATHTPSPTPTATPTASCQVTYTTTTTTGTPQPGGIDIGNHCDDCTTDITLPFPVSVYGNPPVTAVAVGSDGDIHFPGPYNKLFWWPGCVPVDPGTGQDPFLNTFFPNYADLVTDTTVGPCPDCGIFTQTVGTAPNRQFLIRWKANYFNSPPGPAQAEFEVVLTEGSNTLSVIYGVTGDNGLTAVSGIQKDLTHFTSFSCDTPVLTPGLRVNYIPPSCGSPTPTPTPTGTPSPTPTASPSATATATPTPTATAAGCSWSAGPDMPTVLVRAVGVYFPADGNFYTMGGRTADTAGSDFQHVLRYTSSTNTWSQMGVTLPDNQMNNMACGVLTLGGTPEIYCVGGSAAGQTTASARVFYYNPAADNVVTLGSGDNWPGAMGTILPGGFAETGNKMYILGGFNINVASTNQIWSFDPNAAVGSKWVLAPVTTPEGIMYAPTCAIGGIIYVGGASDYQGGTVVDTTNSFSFNPVANTIGTIAAIPRATGETRGLTFNGKMYVMGGGRVAPNPSTEVDVYNPGTNTWTTDLPFTTPRRNFPTDTNGTNKIWLSGGYASDGITPLSSMEIFMCALGSPTPTPTATATATHTPTATPTATATATHTPTATPTATATATHTPTATPTATATATHTPTATPTSTPTTPPRPSPTPRPRPTPPPRP
jgi:hypothetical protein